jgi:hypothetical protein
MKPIFLFLAFAALAASIDARANDVTPKCAPKGSGPSSTNWGTVFDAHVREIFNRAKLKAGVTQDVQLIGIPVETYAGSPISALPKGADKGVDSDAVVYGYAIFEIACDEAQLATFMLHEMKHLQRATEGKYAGQTHFDRVLACRRKMINDWAMNPKAPIPPNADTKAIIAQFDQEKGTEYQQTCVLPVEQEADLFAFTTVESLGYQLNTGKNPYEDARAQAFTNASKWADATGEAKCDPGHTCLDGRAAVGAGVAAKELEVKAQATDALRQARERFDKQSIDPSVFVP